jgi:hypothetical protein
VFLTYGSEGLSSLHLPIGAFVWSTKTANFVFSLIKILVFTIFSWLSTVSLVTQGDTLLVAFLATVFPGPEVQE